MLKIIFFVFSLITIFSHARADDRETILWFVTDFPPTHILSGPDRSTGSGDRRMQILIKNMPQFRHEIVEASVRRMTDSIRDMPNACSAGLLKNADRETYMEFSAPFLHILPNGIIITRARLPLFKPFMSEKEELRVEDLVSSGKYRIGIIAGRSFGSRLDHMIKSNAYPAHLILVPSRDLLLSRLLKLANQREFDAVAGYATEMTYLTRKSGLKAQDFVFLPIAGDPPLTPSFVACSKSEAGKRVISAVDRILANRGTRREADQAYRSWLDKETAIRFDRLIKESRDQSSQ